MGVLRGAAHVRAPAPQTAGAPAGLTIQALCAGGPATVLGAAVARRAWPGAPPFVCYARSIIGARLAFDARRIELVIGLPGGGAGDAQRAAR